MQQLFIIAALTINAWSFAAFALDKWKARRSRQRISERSLLVLTAAGGVLGSYCGMRLFRHKTSKSSFRWKMLPASGLGLFWYWLYFRPF